MKNTILIANDIADELRDSDCEEWKHVTTIRGYEHRWYFDMVTIITKDDITFYGFNWVDDKTDMGDLNPFEYSDDGENVVASEYKAITKVIVDYIPVD